MLYVYLSGFIVAAALCFQSCVSLREMTTSKDYVWVKDSSNRFYYFMEKSLWSKDFADSLKRTSEVGFEKIILKYQEDNFFPFDRMSIFIVEDMAKLSVRFGGAFYFLDLDFNNYRNRKDTIGIISQNGKEPYFITTISRLGLHKNYDYVLALLIYQTLKSVGVYVWKNEFEYAAAIYAQDNWFGYDLHDLAAHYYQNQLTFPFVRWCSNFLGTSSFRNSNLFHGKTYTYIDWVDNQGILYPMTASFYKYVGEKYGVSSLQQWKFRNLDEGIDWYSDEILLEWEAMIKERQKTNKERIDSISYLRLFQPK